MSKKKDHEPKDVEAEAPVVEEPTPTETPVEEPVNPDQQPDSGGDPNTAPPDVPEQVGPNNLPLYRCHKKVEAVKIARFDGYAIVATDGTRIGISADYLTRYSPQIGGYYVVYADGYKSYSPAEAFEDGYSRI